MIGLDNQTEIHDTGVVRIGIILNNIPGYSKLDYYSCALYYINILCTEFNIIIYFFNII